MDMEKVQAVFLCHKIKNQTEKQNLLRLMD